jgi:hypothetical protein
MISHALLGLLFTILTTSCEPINRYIGQDDDWIGEELIESAIEYKFHVPVDLTPSSPE